ncbi:hypothetical protein CAEBREN_31699 [Caenorhabditis brenneri]|uniref:Uncharacterized protein n=1 Tax=Caenorhabditis brenneri TaxID=135651 RepID=G0NT11_CAEBE|nr:hypothetical protein CAEBREN_31699 [Caenorhabditis brenneri]
MSTIGSNPRLPTNSFMPIIGSKTHLRHQQQSCHPPNVDRGAQLKGKGDVTRCASTVPSPPPASHALSGQEGKRKKGTRRQQCGGVMS